MASRRVKLKLRDLGHLQLELEDAKALMDALGEELHPIATAILGAVTAERNLEILLRSKFKRKDDKTWAMLVEDINGPLNSFSSKIVIGYALGIYDERMRNDLDIVRKIRNAFAHSRKLIQFDDPLIVNELGKASKLALPKKYWTGFKPQDRYVSMCYQLSIKLKGIDIRREKSRTYQYERRIRAVSPYRLLHMAAKKSKLA